MSDTPTPQAPQPPKPRRRPHVQFGLPSIDPSTPPQSVNVTLASPKGGKPARRSRPHVQFGLPSVVASTPPQSVNVTLASPKGGKPARRSRPHVQFGPPPAQRDPSAPPPQAVTVKVQTRAA